MSRIGFIGLGAMGEPMVSNLLKKGFQVTVLKHRRADAAQRLEAQGATIASSSATLAQECQTVILCLPTSVEVEAVVLGADGLCKHMARETMVVDCSTSSPDSTLKLTHALKEKGIALIAAAMTRGVLGAKQGTLAFFVGGDAAHLDRVKPTLEAMGNTFVQFDLPSHAHAAKVISNVLSYSTVALVNEALMLGAKSGLDLSILHRALTEGAPSKALEAFGPRLISGEYDPPRVTIDHVCDDLMIAQAIAAATSAPIFGMGVAQEVYRLAQSRGEGARDMSVISDLWRGALASQKQSRR